MSHHHQNSEQNDQSDRLPFVIESIAELNRFIQPEKSIRMILFLWSRFSPKCAELVNSIPPECKRFFYYINIDNPDVRDSILNSSSVKVSEVPCVIVVQTDGVVETYEGNASVDIIKSVYSIVQKITSPQQPQQSMTPGGSRGGSNVTPLSEILGPSIGGEDEDDEEKEIEPLLPEQDESSRHSAVRSKVRQAQRPMDDHRQRIKEQDPPDVGLSSARSYPTKGVGHEGLARSSLGADIKKPSGGKPKQKDIPISGGEMLDDDLDEMLEEDATMDPIIRDVGKTGRTDKKEAMMNVKKAAEEMKRMREMEEEDD